MNIICFGAHPDDCEIFAGGSAVLWARRGDRVLFVSLTNGDIGHYEVAGGPLAGIRRQESARSAEIAGVSYMILDNHDGELLPTLELRKQVIRLIRNWRADVVLTHRPWDYHPDHRNTSLVVQDAAYMVTVPHICPDTQRLETNPVFLYMMDFFKRPLSFQADLAVAVDEVMEAKYSMLDAMESQVYEWLPLIDGRLAQVPGDPKARISWLKKNWDPFFLQPAQTWKGALSEFYSKDQVQHIRYAEMFEVCEYGSHPEKDTLLEIHPHSEREQG